MKNNLLIISFCLLATFSSYAQTKIKDGTVSGSSALPNTGAILDLESTNKGLLLPRVALTATTTWGLSGSITAGMTVYNTATAGDVTPGYYYNDGTQWVRLSSGGAAMSSAWSLIGNAGTTPPTAVGTAVGSANFWGTTDAKNLAIGTNGITRAILDQGGSIIGGINNVSAPGSLANIVWGGNNTITNDLSLNQNRIGVNAIFGNRNTMSNTADGDGGTGANTIISGVNNQAIGGSQAVFGEGNKILDFSGKGTSQNIVAGFGNTLTGFTVQNAVFGISNKLMPNTSHPTKGIGGNLVGGNNNTMVANDFSNYQANLIGGENNKDSASYTVMGGATNYISPAGHHSAVFGENNKVSADHALVAGSNNTVYNHPDAINSNGASGVIIAGDGNKVTRNGSAVFGDLNVVDSWESIVGGEQNTVVQTNTGNNSGNNLVVGQELHVSGVGFNQAFGYSNSNGGNATAVFGAFNATSVPGGFVTGVANAFRGGDPNSGVATDAMFQVGNGPAYNNQSNAFTVLRSGNTAVGTHTALPTSTLQVNGSFSAPISTGTTLGDLDHTVLATGNITLPAPSATNIGRIYILLYDSGSVIVTGSMKLGGNPISAYGLNSSNGGQGITIQSNGTYWVITNKF